MRGTLRELFTRLVFNLFVGNDDDHLRNHAAFWDGARLTLTPAYDLAPQRRSTGTSSQATGITRDGRRASRAVVHDQWDEVCDEARLAEGERRASWGREFCNPYLDHAEP